MVTLPNSATLAGPAAPSSLRSASWNPDWLTIVANKSGRSSIALLTVSPPALLPMSASLDGPVHFSLISHCAAAMRSRQEFALVSR